MRYFIVTHQVSDALNKSGGTLAMGVIMVQEDTEENADPSPADENMDLGVCLFCQCGELV